LNLNYNEPLSIFAINFNLRRYDKVKLEEAKHRTYLKAGHAS